MSGERAGQRRRMVWGSVLATVLALAILVPGSVGVLGAQGNWLPYGIAAAVLAGIGWFTLLSGDRPRRR
ncbi:hypothetical protein GCM10027445_29190 [Amycolatopsis endophytica]|uniref:Putative tellurium resistance membrane protein TerC n=1 Tax=Amycolatopsis endophytica TaxID=860233 RepID=A0A853BC84_9PSEU|nr:hypothetical protein [Amycolatopsis endophytica]NYI91986.1 putative tellurium resistance membrane protein TerC [Amycolatopsis endophytica]